MNNEKEELYVYLLNKAIKEWNKDALKLIPKEYLPCISTNEDDLMRYYSENDMCKIKYILLKHENTDNLNNDTLNIILHLASCYNQKDIIKYALSRGANIHVSNDAPLVHCVQYGNLDVLKYLISNGADIHARNDVSIGLASEFGHLHVVKFLVENGIDIHVKEDFTLAIACRKGHLSIVKYLVENGANLRNKVELLKLSKMSGCIKVFEYLESLD